MIPKSKRRPLRRLDRWCKKLYEKNYTAEVEARVRVGVRHIADTEGGYTLEVAEAVSDCSSREYAITLAGMFFSEFYSNLQEVIQTEELKNLQEEFKQAYRHLDQLVDEAGKRLEKVNTKEKREQEIVKLMRETFRSEVEFVQFKKFYHQMQELLCAKELKDQQIDERVFEVKDLTARIEGKIAPYIVREIFGYMYGCSK